MDCRAFRWAPKGVSMERTCRWVRPIYIVHIDLGMDADRVHLRQNLGGPRPRFLLINWDSDPTWNPCGVVSKSNINQNFNVGMLLFWIRILCERGILVLLIFQCSRSKCMDPKTYHGYKNSFQNPYLGFGFPHDHRIHICYPTYAFVFCIVDGTCHEILINCDMVSTVCYTILTFP